jgi:iron complex outermembrane receptor protein
VAEWNTGIGTGAAYQFHGISQGADWNLGSEDTATPTNATLDWIFGYQNVDVKDDEQWAQIDGAYTFSDGPFTEMKFGLRWSDHDRSLNGVIAQGPNWAFDPFNPAHYPQGFENYPGDYADGIAAISRATSGTTRLASSATSTMPAPTATRSRAITIPPSSAEREQPRRLHPVRFRKRPMERQLRPALRGHRGERDLEPGPSVSDRMATTPSSARPSAIRAGRDPTTPNTTCCPSFTSSTTSTRTRAALRAIEDDDRPDYSALAGNLACRRRRTRASMARARRAPEPGAGALDQLRYLPEWYFGRNRCCRPRFSTWT